MNSYKDTPTVITKLSQDSLRSMSIDLLSENIAALVAECIMRRVKNGIAQALKAENGTEQALQKIEECIAKTGILIQQPVPNQWRTKHNSGEDGRRSTGAISSKENIHGETSIVRSEQTITSVNNGIPKGTVRMDGSGIRYE